MSSLLLRNYFCLELLELQRFSSLLVGESPDKEANHEVKLNSYKGIVSRLSEDFRSMWSAYKLKKVFDNFF
jgi:hypothetical protein